MKKQVLFRMIPLFRCINSTILFHSSHSQWIPFTLDDIQIFFSQDAVAHLDTIPPTEILTLSLEPGGCKGLSYKFELKPYPLEYNFMFISSRSNLLEFVADKHKIGIAKSSIQFIDGSKIDYTSDLIRSGFEVVENPHQDKSCSCGSSFSPKL